MVKSAGKLLKKVFGYDGFRENQQEIIETILNGRDAFALMTTGSGKSLCFQIPSILNDGVGIIISPLIALMEDQVKGLRQNGVRAAYLNSTLQFKEAQKIQRRAADGQIDILYVAPERLLTRDFQHFLTNIKLSLFAIDEAHCVSQWGHDFRPEYLRIREVINHFPEVPRIALTATADAITRNDILEKLDLRRAKLFISSFDRPNIQYHVQAKRSDKQQLIDFINKEQAESSGIVYVRTRKRSESTALWLTQHGIDALPYHAGLPSNVRFENQKQFQENDKQIIVATIAFGMGIDKPDVRFVAHLDLPASMEAYYQETGRAGRDGQPAYAWMVYSLSDVVAIRRFLEFSEGDSKFKNIQRKKLDAILGYCESVECRRKLLLNYFGEKYNGPCQTCDNCLNPVETWDGTIAAQKALSCVYRTGQRFGALHLTNVLLGKYTKQVQRWNHDRINTFGVGKELDNKTWMSVFRQLLSAGYINDNLEGYGGFSLSELGINFLKEPYNIQFRRDLFNKTIDNSTKNKKPTKNYARSDVESDLFGKLRDFRKEIAMRDGMPSYVIFHDKTLHELSTQCPKSLLELQGIFGIGEAKIKKYGEQVLGIILKHIDDTESLNKLKDNRKKYSEFTDDEQKNEEFEFTDSEYVVDHNDNYYLSMTALGKLHNITIKNLYDYFVKIGWTKKKNNRRILTDEGKEKGGRYKTLNQKDFWIVWPEDILDDKTFDSIKSISNSKEKGKHSENDQVFTTLPPNNACSGLEKIILDAVNEVTRIPLNKTDEQITDGRILRIRKKYSRAYEPWSQKEDILLSNLISKSLKVDELTDIFMRQPGAIRSRIKKLDLKYNSVEVKNSEVQTGQIREESENDKKNKNIVCMAVSTKYQGYCIAGKKLETGCRPTWIRPVSPRLKGELPRESLKLSGGSIPHLLDIIHLHIKKPLPHYYQTENYLVDLNRSWEKVGKLKVEDILEFCDPVDRLWENCYHSAYGKNDKIPIQLANEKCESSLLLIKPNDFSILLSSGLTFKQKIRAEFVYNGLIYNFAVTDVFVKKEYANRPEGRYIINDKDIYLCISLGEPMEGFCYKLVAGVIIPQE